MGWLILGGFGFVTSVFWIASEVVFRNCPPEEPDDLGGLPKWSAG